MTDTNTSTDSTPKKSNKTTIVAILLVVVLLGLLDYFKTNVFLGKGECSSNDSTSVTPVAVDTVVPTPVVVDTIIPTPVVVAVDTTIADTTKK